MPDKHSDLQPAFAYLEGRVPLRAHEHVTVLHFGAASGMSWGGFISQGLRLGNWCYYRAPAHRRRNMLARLRELGVNVERHLANHSLQFGLEHLEPARLGNGAQALFAQAEEARASAVRWVEEGVQPGTEGAASPDFFEFHSRLNYLVKHYPSVALCQYDVKTLEIAQLFSAIIVHRHLLVEGTLVRDHPFYIPPEKFMSLGLEDRDRDLRQVFRAVGSDVRKLLSTLAGYGQIQELPPPGAFT